MTLDQPRSAAPPIGFAPPYIDEATIAAVERVLRSGWITTGPETSAFEEELAAYTGADQVVCGGSWTGLAGVVLDWFGVGPGDEVILPAYTYCATANVVLHRGATPVLLDLPPGEKSDGLNVTWDQVASRLSSRTKVIMPVDIGGWPVHHSQWKSRLEAWSKQNGFVANHPEQSALGRPLLLADSAHSLGAEIEGKALGHQADITLFSFHAVKNLTTAEGGAAGISLPDSFSADAVKKQLKSLCLHGQTKDADAKFRASGRGAWQYDVTSPGFKCNMTDIQAAMGRVALSRYAEDLQHRRSLADAYDVGLSQVSAITLPFRIDLQRKSADHLYPIQLSEEWMPFRDDIMAELAERGIATNVHFPPIPLLTAYAERGFDVVDYPESHQAFLRAISLPIHRHMSLSDVQRVCNAIAEIGSQLPVSRAS